MFFFLLNSLHEVVIWVDVPNVEMTWSIGWRKPHCILGHCLNPSQSISIHLNASECISMHQSLHISPLTASHCPQHPNRLARPPGRDWGGRFPLPSLLLPNLPLSLHHTSRVHSTTSDQSIPTLSELPSLSHFLNFSPTTSQMKLPMGAHINQFFSIHFVTTTISGQL